MILFGAGISVSFGIPTMKGFTDSFYENVKGNEPLIKLIDLINTSLKHSKESVGTELTYDLESLLSVLTDLSITEEKKFLSIATMTLLFEQKKNIEELRKIYGDLSKSGILLLKKFIIDTCMKPINDGRKNGDYNFLDNYYAPLFSILNKGNINSQIDIDIKNIYSTNWDICFKQWVEYRNIFINDGTKIDRQGKPYFDTNKYNEAIPAEYRDILGFNYIPLHGSLDLVNLEKYPSGGKYENISKISDPIGYFNNNPAHAENIFMIYPLEAVGYEESIKSPYLDLLIRLKNSLETEFNIIVIGYSFRDPTITSIFEEASKRRIRLGDVKPLSSDLLYRVNEAHENRFRIVIISRDANKLQQTLISQGFKTLASIFIPIELNFPSISDPEYFDKFSTQIKHLINRLGVVQYFTESEVFQRVTQDYPRLKL